MVQLSSPIQDIKDHYTVVVIGSGYGGGIAASRLARAGQTVCVLERGKEFQPGQFPDTNTEFLNESQIHLADGSVIGPRTGLYDFRLNPDLNVLVGCGLGGTSLINAGVVLRPEPRIFADACWPRQLRDEVATTLEDGYRRAEDMLKPAPYPDKFPPLPKMEALRKSARAFGDDKFSRLPINVNFVEYASGANHVGVPQVPCNMCGDCMCGCNHRAKNTVDVNYLPDAKNHGAEIYTCVEVRTIERQAGHWVVHFQLNNEGRGGFDAPEAFVSADIVILAAGTFGSTEILLRSKAAGLPLSDQVGQHFSGNGDVLGFAYNTETPVNMVGAGYHNPSIMPVVGPVITSVIDLRHQDQVDDGLVIEEGGVAGALSTYLSAAMATAARLMGPDSGKNLTEIIAERTRELDSLVRGPYQGAIKNTQVFLVMSHDDSGGSLYIDQSDEVRLTWPGAGEQQFVTRAYEKLKRAVQPLGGQFVENPLWSKLESHNLVSAHPLGGCVMAEDAEHGVVNHKGQVFAGVHGTDVYEGLIVNDGAIVPRSLGCNPHITIAALAERNCAALIKDRGWQIDYGFAPVAPAEPLPERPGIKFTEAMEGYFSTQIRDDFTAGERQGEADGSTLRFVVTIESDDLDEMVRNPNHMSRLFGTVTAPALSQEVLTTEDGEFYLFPTDPDLPETRLMHYRMKLVSQDGSVYYFDGRKFLHDNVGFDIVADTTTLYVTIYQGDSDQAPVLGKGIVRIKLKDLQQQIRTMQVTNVADPGTRIAALGKFSRFLYGEVFDIYGGIFARPTVFDPDAPPRKKRPLRVGPPELHYFQTADGLRLRLIRYQGGTKGPVLCAHGLGVSSSLFSTDLIETNLLEYLYTYGYDIWLLDYRSSIELPYARTQYTADDIAVYDWPAAVKTVLDLTGAPSVQAVVHCYGAITFNMAMLAGLQGVRSAVCSQVGSHLVVNTASKVKAVLHLDEFLKAAGIKDLTMYTDAHENWVNQLYDDALKVYPVAPSERCNSAVCHRVTFLFAPLYSHSQLNAQTHDNLHELFGAASISNFEHIARMSRAGHIVDSHGNDVYLPHIDRMKIPIAFIHGADNQTWLPDSTRRTYELLCEKNGKELYSRYLIPHHGHIDCIFGRNASNDVFPLILKHLEATQ